VSWVIAENRPALRGLVRAFQWRLARDERDSAVTTAERLMELIGMTITACDSC